MKSEVDGVQERSVSPTRMFETFRFVGDFIVVDLAEADTVAFLVNAAFVSSKFEVTKNTESSIAIEANPKLVLVLIRFE